jgi:hypothetical protein
MECQRSLRKASSVADFNTINNKFKEIYCRMFEQGKRFLSWSPVIGFSHNLVFLKLRNSRRKFNGAAKA